MQLTCQQMILTTKAVPVLMALYLVSILNLKLLLHFVVLIVLQVVHMLQLIRKNLITLVIVNIITNLNILLLMELLQCIVYLLVISFIAIPI